MKSRGILAQKVIPMEATNRPQGAPPPPPPHQDPPRGGDRRGQFIRVGSSTSTEFPVAVAHHPKPTTATVPASERRISFGFTHRHPHPSHDYSTSSREPKESITTTFPSDRDARLFRLDPSGLSSHPTRELRPHSSTTTTTHSPSVKTNITIPKRQYSISRHDSLEVMEMPSFSVSELRLRKETPSSQRTVLIMAGLFVCGTIAMLSGLIVIVHQREAPFVASGRALLCIGSFMLLICALLQRKNIKKFFRDLNRDLYFLKMSDYAMWRMVFREPVVDEGVTMNGKYGRYGGGNEFLKWGM